MKTEIFFDTLQQLEIAGDTAFLLWQYQDVEGRKKLAKVPISTTKTRINPTIQENLITLEAAKMAYLGGVGDGIGYSLGFNDVICIDVDNCIIGEGFNYNAIGAHIAELFWGTYCETSPSLNGLHFFIKAKLPDKRNRLKIEVSGAIYEVEIYSEKRYIAVTGLLENSSTEIKRMQIQLDKLYSSAIANNANSTNSTNSTNNSTSTSTSTSTSGGGGKCYSPPLSCVINPCDDDFFSVMERSKNAEKFNLLWAGTWQTSYKSQSEADLALCSMIAFYSQNECFVDEKFRASGLMREKWNNNKTYRNNTLQLAINNLKGKYIMMSNDNDKLSLEDFINENLISTNDKADDKRIVELPIIGFVKFSELAIKAHVAGSVFGMDAEVVSCWIPKKISKNLGKPKILGVQAWFVAKGYKESAVIVS